VDESEQRGVQTGDDTGHRLDPLLCIEDPRYKPHVRLGQH